MRTSAHAGIRPAAGGARAAVADRAAGRAGAVVPGRRRPAPARRQPPAARCEVARDDVVVARRRTLNEHRAEARRSGWRPRQCTAALAAGDVAAAAAALQQGWRERRSVRGLARRPGCALPAAAGAAGSAAWPPPRHALARASMPVRVVRAGDGGAAGAGRARSREARRHGRLRASCRWTRLTQRRGKRRRCRAAPTWRCARAAQRDRARRRRRWPAAAEALARQGADSELRVAAAVPDGIAAPVRPGRAGRAGGWASSCCWCAAGCWLVLRPRAAGDGAARAKSRPVRPWPTLQQTPAAAPSRCARAGAASATPPSPPCSGAGGDRPPHLPRLRHPRRRRPDAGRRRGRTDRPGDRHA